MADPVAKLYEATGALNSALAKGSIAGASKYYDTIISSVTGPDSVKQLAADNLPLYFHHFPALQERSLNSQLDLIEDSSLQIRVRAIKGLELLAKHTQSLIPRLADVLTQLLLTDDAHEQNTIKAAFTALFALDAPACFVVLLNQIREGEDKLRTRSFEFFNHQLTKYRTALLQSTPVVQIEVANKIKAVLTRSEPVQATEFKTLLTLSLALKVVKDDPDLKADLATIVATQARLDRDFEADDNGVAAFVSGVRSMGTLRSQAIEPTPFVRYFIDKVRPKFMSLTDKQRIEVARSLTTLLASLDAKSAKAALDAVWNLAKEFAPVNNKSDASEANESNGDRYAVLEALLVATHSLAAQSPEGTKTSLGLFVATGQPGESAIEEKKADTHKRTAGLIENVHAWAANVKAAISATQKSIKEAKSDADKKKSLQSQLNAFRADARVAASLLALASAFNEKIPTFFAAPPSSWRKTKKATGEGNQGKGEAAKGKGSKGGKSTADSSNKSRRRNGGEDESSSAKKQKSQVSNQPASQSQQSTSGKRKRGGGDQQQSDASSSQPAKKRKSDAGQQQPQQQQSQSKKQNSNRGHQQQQQAQAQLMNPLLNPQMMAAYAAQLQQATQFYAGQFGGQFQQQSPQQASRSNNQKGRKQGQGQGNQQNNGGGGQAQRSNSRGGRKRGRQ